MIMSGVLSSVMAVTSILSMSGVFYSLQQNT